MKVLSSGALTLSVLTTSSSGIEEDRLVQTFLSVIGPSTFNLLWCLVQLEKTGSKSYDSIVTIWTSHFSSKLLVIAEHFRFHKRNQAGGESVTVLLL